MSDDKQLFSASLAKDAVYKTGLRRFMEYRDVVQPAGIVHNELDCSDDLEILEVYSPAVHETVVVDEIPEAAAAR